MYCTGWIVYIRLVTKYHQIRICPCWQNVLKMFASLKTEGETKIPKWSKNCLPFRSIWVQLRFSLCYWSLVFCVVFCTSLFVLFPFFLFGHCIVCPSIYDFWLPLWSNLFLILAVVKTCNSTWYILLLYYFPKQEPCFVTEEHWGKY